MICNNCGFENSDNATFCQNCGCLLSCRQNTATGRIQRLLNDKLFLAMCILYSVSAGGGVIRLHFSVFTILTMIFLWLVFAQSRKNIVATNYLRCISGTIFASYIANWILCGSIAVLSLIFALFPGLVGIRGLLHDMLWKMGLYKSNHSQCIGIASSVFIWMLSILLILFSVGGILVNVFGRRSIHRFAQSVYKSAENESVDIVMRKKAQTWMMVLGILSAVSAFLNIAEFLAQGGKAAALIIGSILIKKHLGDIE